MGQYVRLPRSPRREHTTATSIDVTEEIAVKERREDGAEDIRSRVDGGFEPVPIAHPLAAHEAHAVLYRGMFDAGGREDDEASIRARWVIERHRCNEVLTGHDETKRGSLVDRNMEPIRIVVPRIRDRDAVREHVEHDNTERNHQGIGNVIPMPSSGRGSRERSPWFGESGGACRGNPARRVADPAGASPLGGQTDRLAERAEAKVEVGPTLGEGARSKSADQADIRKGRSARAPSAAASDTRLNGLGEGARGAARRR